MHYSLHSLGLWHLEKIHGLLIVVLQSTWQEKIKNLSKLEENNSLQKVSLGDDYQYPIKGIGEASYKIDSGAPMKMKEVLYVPGLKKNLLSILALDKKGYRVAFIYGQVLMWPKGKPIEDAVVIDEEEGGLYKLKGHLETTLVHETTNPSELC